MKVTEEIRAYGRYNGSAGGKARAVKLTPERRSEIARLAAIARWGRPRPTPKAKPEAES